MLQLFHFFPVFALQRKEKKKLGNFFTSNSEVLLDFLTKCLPKIGRFFFIIEITNNPSFYLSNDDSDVWTLRRLTHSWVWTLRRLGLLRLNTPTFGTPAFEHSDVWNSYVWTLRRLELLRLNTPKFETPTFNVGVTILLLLFALKILSLFIYKEKLLSF